MPKYKYPAETIPALAPDEKDEKRQPRLHMPAGAEQVSSLEVGSEVEVTLRGTVAGVETRKRENQQGPEGTLELELVESEVYAQKEGGKKKKSDAADEDRLSDMLEGE